MDNLVTDKAIEAAYVPHDDMQSVEDILIAAAPYIAAAALRQMGQEIYDKFDFTSSDAQVIINMLSVKAHELESK